jgi:hypothetical protein
MASVMYRKSTHEISSSGVISARSLQTGFSSTLAQRSHTAFTNAPVARWITPFSGPTHLSWDSLVRLRQNPAESAWMACNVRPSTRGARASMAATQSSFPRPMVKVSPCPSSPVG